MQTSAEQLFEQMGRLYQNIWNLLIGFQQASVSNQSDITVQQINPDGVVEEVTINSFQQLLSELRRLDNNFIAITNENNISYIVNGDGSVSQTTRTSFINAEYLENFDFGTDCIIDHTSILKNMVFPNVKIPVQIDSTIKTDIRAKIYEIVDGWDNLPEDDISVLNLDYLISQGQVIANIDEIVLPLEKERVNFFGKFTVINTTPIVNNEQTITLDKITYSGLNTIAQNLVVGNLLATNIAKFEILEINNFSKILKVKRIAGTTPIVVGIDNLVFNELLSTDIANIVGIPVQPNKRMVAFLSTENLKFISYPSMGIKIDTSTFSVTTESETLTLDEYFNKYVTNISEYLYSLIRETTIPISLGILPNTPSLNTANFKVIQINKHLTDAKSTKEIESLNEQKQKVQNDIEYTNIEINKINNDISTLKFKSVEEKQYRITQVAHLRDKLNTLNTNLLTITRNLNNNAIQFGLKNVKPKYRLIGMWDIQKPIFSPLTKPQNIIKYDVQYRYLSKNIDIVDSTSYKMINNEGKEVSVVISPWNNLETPVLQKVQNIDGSVSWQIPVFDSIDDISINQLNIPISEGESVEFRVRALSEAGYPVGPLKSEWSEIMRVDFPQNLTESSLNSIVSKNEDDLKKSEFNDILQASGILNHISKQIRESEKLFTHPSSDIASGFYTNEQKIIPLDVFLQQLNNNINILMNRDSQEVLKIELIDFNNEKYTVINNSTMEIDGGNYSDNFNLIDATKYGSIIRKQGFIRISNQNTIPIEIKTLVPGTIFDSTTASKYYNVPVKTPDALVQRSKQILYFRNVDITGQNEDIFRLVKEKLSDTVTYPNPLYLDETALEDAKNIVFYDFASETFATGKLLPNANNDFICFTKEHPLYNPDDLTPLIDEFNRIRKYTATLKAPIYQEEPFINGELIEDALGFVDNDFYSIGENSCGAFLYPVIANPTSVSVVGNNTISTLIIPASSEIIIPFIYEYRMMDRFGRVNGSTDLTINDKITYNKKIGIDILINNETFRFDINVTSKLRSTIIPIESLNVSSVVGQFGNEEQENIE